LFTPDYPRSADGSLCDYHPIDVNRPAAPGAVREDVQAALALLVEQPGLGTVVSQASSQGVRRFHIDRIQYWVYDRVRGSRLEVLSVWHSSRGTGPAV